MLFLRFTSSIAVDVQPCSGAAAKRYHCGLSNLRCRRVTRHVTGRYGCNGTNNCALTSRTSSCSTDLVLVPPEEVPDSTYLAHKPRHGLDLCRDGWHGKNWKYIGRGSRMPPVPIWVFLRVGTICLFPLEQYPHNHISSSSPPLPPPLIFLFLLFFY